MTPPRQPASEPDPADDGVHPDDLLSIAANEAAKNEQGGGEADVNAGNDEEAAPADPGASLPAVRDDATPVEITSAALRAFADDEWAAFEDEDGGLLNWQHVGFSIPRILSDMRPGGGWTDEPTGKTFDVLDAIVVAAMPNRALFTKKFGKGETKVPDCRSADMVYADKDAPAMQEGWTPPDRDDADAMFFTKPTGTCATCPASQWHGDDAPVCGERINMLVYLPDTGDVRRMAVGGTSTKHFRKYASALVARAGRKPIYAQVTRMTIEPVERDGMRWLEAHFEAGEPVPPREALTTIKPLKDKLTEQWKSLLAEALASGEAEGAAVARDVVDGAIDADSHDRYPDEEPF